MELSELCPYPNFIEWEGEQIELRPFDLRAITWAERFFFKENQNGFERMYSILKNPNDENLFFNTVIDIIFYLGSKDFKKMGVKSSVELKKGISEKDKKALELEKAIQSAIIYKLGLEDDDKIKIIESEIEKAKSLSSEITDYNLSDTLEIFGEAIEKVIVSSFPKQKSRKMKPRGNPIYNRYIENREQKTDWKEIWYEFFRLGGVTFDFFMSLTMRQIEGLTGQMRFKRHEDLNILSDLIHKKILIKKPHPPLPEIEFTEKDVETFEKIHQKLMEGQKIN